MIRLLASTMGLVFLAGCASPPPYVHRPEAINRDSPYFARQRDDLASVTVCYAKPSASPDQIIALAVQACGAYGKRAVFDEQTYQVCPLTTPVGAIYNCVAPQAGDSSGGLPLQ